MSSKVLIEHEFTVGKGLGKLSQGILTPIEVTKRKKWEGLGYQGDQQDQGNQKSLNIKEKSYRCLLSPPLKDFFPRPPKFLQDEEIDIYDIINLFEESYVGAIFESVEDDLPIDLAV